MKGAIFFGLDNSAKFLSALRSITGTIDDVSDDSIFDNYRLHFEEFRQALQQNARQISYKQEYDQNMFELNNAAVGRN